MKPVLVIVLSKSCPACINFKKNTLSKMEKELNNDSKFKTVILEYPDFNVTVSSLPGQPPIHPELKNGFIRFFPTLILFPGNLWSNHKSKLKGVIKHGDEPMDKPKIDYSKNSIVNWIDTTLKNDPLFKQTEPIPDTAPLIKKLDNGNYIVPTYGTYTKFKNATIDENE